MATYLGANRIRACLTSLAAQSLTRDDFEIVVVQNGPACATPDVVRELRREHPGLRLRLLETLRPGASAARNIGIDAARGAWVTFVDDDDWVSPDYLAGLLGAAGPGVVPHAFLADVPEDSPADGARGDFDNYISRQLLPREGRTVPVHRLPVALSANAGKLLPTALARQVRYDEALSSGEDFVFWTDAYARAGFEVRVTDRAAGAVYYRTVRTNSVSRQDPGYDFNVRQRLDCLSVLDQHQINGSPRLAAVVRAMKAGQVDLMRQYVVAHPEERERVVEDIKSRGMRDVFPWQLLNRGQARDLAVLYCFTPYLDTSALVAARRLRARGLITDVISQSMDNVRTKDWTSQQVAREFLDTTRVLPGDASFSGWEATRLFTRRVLRAVEKLQAEKGSYRSLYSRAMAPQSHFAAAVVKLRNPTISWTAEFSDPLLMNPYGQERDALIGDDDWLITELRDGIVAAGFAAPPTRQLFLWAELVAYALADEIVFTNENQRTFMLEHCLDPVLAERVAAISSVSHHPTLPERFYEMSPAAYPLSPDLVHIGYFGVFYVTRGLTEVIAALEALDPVERSLVRLHVFTDKPDELELQVLTRNLSDVILVRPYVPFLEFLNLTLKFDALLVNDASTTEHHKVNPYLPSKISDYRGSGTPVWAIHEPGSVLSTIDTEYSSRLGDSDGATETLRRIIAAGHRARD